jgi:hypothetical protein
LLQFVERRDAEVAVQRDDLVGTQARHREQLEHAFRHLFTHPFEARVRAG